MTQTRPGPSRVDCVLRANGQMVELRPMLQATRSFTAVHDGEIVVIDLNTRVAVGHAIALAHPDAFAPLVGAGINARVAGQSAGATARARSATTTPSRGDSEPLYLTPSKRPTAKTSLRAPDQAPVVLRDVPSAVTVSVSSTAYEAIKKECLRFASRRGIETGGYLAGHALRSWDRSADVCDATGPGPETEHGVGSVTLDRAPAEGLPRTFAWSGEDIAEAGFWHTHPGSTTKPSPEDLASWGHGLERVSAARGSGAYLGLIVTPSQSVAGTTRGCTPT